MNFARPPGPRHKAQAHGVVLANLVLGDVGLADGLDGAEGKCA
ncbi:MAG: hypothetical protein PW789_14585 [Edaphobacter sp.]|nr:hypothetical protein [Edaphobacter sp.]MDE1177806.1 hypothetical protein [Edaphobacter sp.]